MSGLRCVGCQLSNFKRLTDVGLLMSCCVVRKHPRKNSESNGRDPRHPQPSICLPIKLFAQTNSVRLMVSDKQRIGRNDYLIALRCAHQIHHWCSHKSAQAVAQVLRNKGPRAMCLIICRKVWHDLQHLFRMTSAMLDALRCVMTSSQKFSKKLGIAHMAVIELTRGGLGVEGRGHIALLIEF